MPRDLRPEPDSPPTDELESAEACLAVLQHVLHAIADSELSRQPPCAEFNVEHMAGADIPAASLNEDSVERQVVAAARPVVEA